MIIRKKKHRVKETLRRGRVKRKLGCWSIARKEGVKKKERNREVSVVITKREMTWNPNTKPCPTKQVFVLKKKRGGARARHPESGVKENNVGKGKTVCSRTWRRDGKYRWLGWTEESQGRWNSCLWLMIPGEKYAGKKKIALRTVQGHFRNHAGGKGEIA